MEGTPEKRKGFLDLSVEDLRTMRVREPRHARERAVELVRKLEDVLGEIPRRGGVEVTAEQWAEERAAIRARIGELEDFLKE